MIHKLKKYRNKLIIITAIIVVGLLVFRSNANKNNTENSQSAKVTRGTLTETLTISGSINADESVVLQFQTAGRLSYVGVKEGDYVRKGQLIATLDQRELQKRLQQDLNTFVKTRIDLDQGRDNNKDIALTTAISRTLDKNQLTLNSSILDVELQDIALQYSRLTTPIEGIVTSVQSPFAGVNIIPSQAQFEIINPRTMYFSALADQSEVTLLNTDMSGELLLDSYSDKTIRGEIKKIALTPKSGETSTVYDVTFEPEQIDQDSKYRIGMTGDLTFVIKQKNNALSIPISFVTEENGNKTVVVMEKNKKITRKVRTGMETDTNVEILSGLHENEIVYD